MYILGRPVIVQTDHQPLVKIFQKPLTEAPLRIQRMLLGLQRYQITLTFKPGKQIVIADILSRAAQIDNDITSREIYDIFMTDIEHICALDYLPISDARVDEIRLKSREDPDIQLIIRCIIDGWPQKYDEMPAAV